MSIYWSVVGIFCSLKQECMILNPPTDGTKLDVNIGGGFKYVLFSPLTTWGHDPIQFD